jgi:hypothetical protein
VSNKVLVLIRYVLSHTRIDQQISEDWFINLKLKRKKYAPEIRGKLFFLPTDLSAMTAINCLHVSNS